MLARYTPVLLLLVLHLRKVSAGASAVYVPPYGEKINPKPFKYQYGVSSEESQVAFSKKENQDATGNVNGEVVVVLPDGRTQTTLYKADHQDGYMAEVHYGEQKHSSSDRRPLKASSSTVLRTKPRRKGKPKKTLDKMRQRPKEIFKTQGNFQSQKIMLDGSTNENLSGDSGIPIMEAMEKLKVGFNHKKTNPNSKKKLTSPSDIEIPQSMLEIMKQIQKELKGDKSVKSDSETQFQGLKTIQKAQMNNQHFERMKLQDLTSNTSNNLPAPDNAKDPFQKLTFSSSVRNPGIQISDSPKNEVFIPESMKMAIQKIREGLGEENNKSNSHMFARPKTTRTTVKTLNPKFSKSKIKVSTTSDEPSMFRPFSKKPIKPGQDGIPERMKLAIQKIRQELGTDSDKPQGTEQSSSKAVIHLTTKTPIFASNQFAMPDNMMDMIKLKNIDIKKIPIVRTTKVKNKKVTQFPTLKPIKSESVTKVAAEIPESMKLAMQKIRQDLGSKTDDMKVRRKPSATGKERNRIKDFQTIKSAKVKSTTSIGDISESMKEAMKKIRQDLGASIQQKTNTLTPSKFIPVTTSTKSVAHDDVFNLSDNMMEMINKMNIDIKKNTEGLSVATTTAKPEVNEKMAVIMKKIRENLTKSAPIIGTSKPIISPQPSSGFEKQLSTVKSKSIEDILKDLRRKSKTGAENGNLTQFPAIKPQTNLSKTDLPVIDTKMKEIMKKIKADLENNNRPKEMKRRKATTLIKEGSQN